MLPDAWVWLYRLNPMFWVVDGFRWAVLNTGTPAQPQMLIAVSTVAVLLLSGCFVFRRAERTIVDLL